VASSDGRPVEESERRFCRIWLKPRALRGAQMDGQLQGCLDRIVHASCYARGGTCAVHAS
jgi:hypothetical protein